MNLQSSRPDPYIRKQVTAQKPSPKRTKTLARKSTKKRAYRVAVYFHARLHTNKTISAEISQSHRAPLTNLFDNKVVTIPYLAFRLITSAPEMGNSQSRRRPEIRHAAPDNSNSLRPPTIRGWLRTLPIHGCPPWYPGEENNDRMRPMVPIGWFPEQGMEGEQIWDRRYEGGYLVPHLGMSIEAMLNGFGDCCDAVERSEVGTEVLCRSPPVVRGRREIRSSTPSVPVVRGRPEILSPAPSAPLARAMLGSGYEGLLNEYQPASVI